MIGARFPAIAAMAMRIVTPQVFFPLYFQLLSGEIYLSSQWISVTEINAFTEATARACVSYESWRIFRASGPRLFRYTSIVDLCDGLPLTQYFHTTEACGWNVQSADLHEHGYDPFGASETNWQSPICLPRLWTLRFDNACYIATCSHSRSD